MSKGALFNDMLTVSSAHVWEVDGQMSVYHHEHKS